MDTNDVIEIANAFPDAIVVPLHVDGWAHLTQNGADIAASFDILGPRFAAAVAAIRHSHTGRASRDLDAMGRGEAWHHRRGNQPMERLMPHPNDLSRSLVALEQDATLIAVIEMGQASWLVAGIVPGLERQPLKKLAADPDTLLQLLHRWRNEAMQAGRSIKRIARRL